MGGGERERDLEKMLGSGGTGQCISERLPILGEHSTVGVSDFDSVIGHFVMRGCDHDPNN